MRKIILLIFFLIVVHFSSCSLAEENELLYIDFRADAISRKLKECIEGNYVETNNGIKISPNTVFSIDFERLAMVHQYSGNSLYFVMQFDSEFSLHPSIQIDMVFFIRIYNK